MNNDTTFTYRNLAGGDLDDLLRLESDVIQALSDHTILRCNTISMWKTCLQQPHYTVGAYIGEHLVAISVLYIPVRGEDDDLSQSLTSPRCRSIVSSKSFVSANHKICMVHPNYRGNGLQLKLADMVERYALEQGVVLLCATISPHNLHSRQNALSMGMVYDSTIPKYGGKRDLFYKLLQ